MAVERTASRGPHPPPLTQAGVSRPLHFHRAIPFQLDLFASRSCDPANKPPYAPAIPFYATRLPTYD